MRLSLKQVLASVLGATAAALALSFLGVGGTMVGVVVGSAAATVGTGLAFHSLERGHEKVRAIVKVTPPPPVAPTASIEPPVVDADVSPWSSNGPSISTPPPSPLPPVGRSSGPRWPLAAVILLVIALTMGVLTLAELALGHPISSSLSKEPAPAAKTSIGDVFSRGSTTTTTSTTTAPTTTTPASSTTTTSTTTTTTSTSTTTTTSTTMPTPPPSP